MSPLFAVLLVVGIDRFLRLDRPRVLAPIRRRWANARPRIAAAVKSAPMTSAYAAILFVTTWVLASSRGRLADRLLLAQSTNLHQLARDPVRVLINSAFWLSGTGTLLIWVALLMLVVAPVERRIGSLRTGFVFWLGHVGATLLTAAGLWTALRLDTVERSVVNAKDVGPSYGFLAVAGALTYLLAPRLRLPYVGVLTVGVVAVVAFSHTFTDFGHLLSLLIGLACYRIVRGRSESPIDWRRSFGIRRATSAPRGSPESAA